MRLFIAIMLSDEMKKSVIGTMHELKKADVRGSYVPAQNLHVTLAFIGETKDAAAVKAAMQTISCKPRRFPTTERNSFRTSRSSATWAAPGRRCLRPKAT